MEERVKKLREAMSREGIEAFLVCGRANRCYLSGFSGSAGWALITEEKAFLLTDGRYREQAEKECPPFWEVQEVKWGKVPEILHHLLQEEGIGVLHGEEEHVSHFLWLRLEEALAGVELRSARGLVERLRRVKGPEEVKRIREAVRIAERALAATLPLLREGVQEREVAAELDYRMRREGAEAPAFETIVAFGIRTSLPHARAGEARLSPGDTVLIDFGARWQGYHSDLTRTFFFGRSGEEEKRIYRAVLRAQREALQAAGPGIPAREVDSRARQVLEEEGWKDCFPHGLGHGVGLEIHEAPRLGEEEEEPLEPGMVVTFEPGVYLPGRGGVRIEDLGLITEEGVEVLTSFPREIMELEG